MLIVVYRVTMLVLLQSLDYAVLLLYHHLLSPRGDLLDCTKRFVEKSTVGFAVVWACGNHGEALNCRR